jgi:hypothetical protein
MSKLFRISDYLNLAKLIAGMVITSRNSKIRRHVVGLRCYLQLSPRIQILVIRFSLNGIRICSPDQTTLLEVAFLHLLLLVCYLLIRVQGSAKVSGDGSGWKSLILPVALLRCFLD